MNLLVVEDDRRIASLLQQGLREDGHNVYLSHNGREGLDLITSSHFDVVVLDLMLPELDGFSILKRARVSKCEVPIVVLTAKDAIPDVVRALDLGADDYLAKPFHLEVLLARVRAVSRRGFGAVSEDMRLGDLVLHRSQRIARRGDRSIPLTKKEFLLLELLMRRANQIATRDQLIEAGWGYNEDVRDSTLDFYIHALRSKIDGKQEPSLIRTIRSVGYSLALPG
jgi:two-component system copper resistance phosphate regulon response regulator CusR